MIHEAFDRFAKWCAWLIGHPVTMLANVAAILLWIVWGAFVWFDERWHDWGVTPITVFTYLILFPIAYKQNQTEATVVAHVKEIAEDVPDVDEHRARERAREEECR